MSAVLSQVSPSINTNVVAYTAPVAKYAVLTVNFVAVGSESCEIWLGVASNSSPSAAEWVIYNFTIDPYKPYTYKGLVVPSGKSIVVKTSKLSSVAVWGFEE